MLLPFNVLSILAYGALPGVYEGLTGGRFFTFGWSEEDARRYIYERDEYMAGTLASLLRSGRRAFFLPAYVLLLFLALAAVIILTKGSL